MARRWFFLAKNMAGRIGDTHDIGPAQIVLENARAYLEWQPKKKGSKLVRVPIMLELIEELRVGPRHPDGFLLNEHGRPFASSTALGNKVREWIIVAGLCVDAKDEDGNPVYVGKGKRKIVRKKATRSQHGIRKATAHELARSGATVYEIAARLSHSDFKSSKPYVDEVDRNSLGESGFARVQAARNAGVPRPENRGTPEGVSANEIRDLRISWQPVGESNPSFQVENLTS